MINKVPSYVRRVGTRCYHDGVHKDEMDLSASRSLLLQGFNGRGAVVCGEDDSVGKHPFLFAFKQPCHDFNVYGGVVLRGRQK